MNVADVSNNILVHVVANGSHRMTIAPRPSVAMALTSRLDIIHGTGANAGCGMVNAALGTPALWSSVAFLQGSAIWAVIG